VADKPSEQGDCCATPRKQWWKCTDRTIGSKTTSETAETPVALFQLPPLPS
jgi:hypothetical protein